MADEHYCYLGRKDCGCVVAAVVDDPEHKGDVAKDVAEFIRGGLSIERVTAQTIRDEFARTIGRGCCLGKAKQESLFL